MENKGRWEKIKEVIKNKGSFIIFIIVAGVWGMALFFQLLYAFFTGDYNMFKEYGVIALTIFGFTLIGGIFEYKNKHSEIEKKLFKSSLSFLITAISFFILYAVSYFFKGDITILNIYQQILIIVPFIFAMFIGYFGFTNGLLNLYRTLKAYQKVTLSIGSKK